MKWSLVRWTTLTAAALVLVSGCNKPKSNPGAEAPPQAVVVSAAGGDGPISVDHPDEYVTTPVQARSTKSTLNVTGQVSADISRTIPVISLANGRVVDVHARLGDFVHKGQLLFEVQSTDVSGALALYIKAVNDERLASGQLERSKILYAKGATPKSLLDIAETGELDARTDLRAAEQQLRVLGIDKNNPGATVKVYAPATGVIIAQNVTSAGAAGVGLSGSSTAFTIADLSHVWVICDVYENDLSSVHLGETADIRLNAYPNQPPITGTVSDIGAVLDPTIRTAKVRIQVPNPHLLMRVGMFATATLNGTQGVVHTFVPATAVLHLQDRDWVFVPTGSGHFRRIAVGAGPIMGTQQEILSGVQAGQPVVVQALALQNAISQ